MLFAASLAIVATLQGVSATPVAYSLNKESWEEAKAICETHGRRLCNQEEICVDGEYNAPIDGMGSRDLWTPTGEEENAWLSIGNMYASSRLCRLHHVSLGQKPDWGTTSGSYVFRQHDRLYCCGGPAPRRGACAMGTVKPHHDGSGLFLTYYTEAECDSLNGTWSSNGECLKAGGGSYTYDCSYNAPADGSNLELQNEDGSKTIYRSYHSGDCDA